MTHPSAESTLRGRVVVDGSTVARVLKSNEPLSFWGGFDQATGEIIDRRHSLSGSVASGCIMAIPFTRGSSTTTSILIEAVRAGVGPAGIITTEVDSFLALASIVADEMYNASFPVLSVNKADFDRISDGDQIQIREGGEIIITSG